MHGFIYSNSTTKFMAFHAILRVVMARDSMTEFVAAHPKITGVLFTAMLLLSQAGAVAAGGNGYAGP